MKSLLWIASLLISTTCFSQGYFNKTFGLANGYGRGTAVVVLSDSSFMLAGIAPWSNEVLTARLHKTGDTIWTRHYPYVIYDGRVSLLKETDSTFIATCSWFRPLNDRVHQLFIKIDLQGDTVWSQIPGNLNDREVSGKAIRDADGNYVAVGTEYFVLEGLNGAYGHLLFSKVSPAGNALIKKIYMSDVRGLSLAQAADGGYIVVGVKEAGTSFSTLNEIFYAKLDPLGNMIWSNVLSNPGNDAAQDVLCLPDGRFIVCGYRTVSSGTYYNAKKQVWAGMFDANGNLLYEKLFTDGEYDRTNAFSIIPTIDGHFVMVGNFETQDNKQSKAYILKVDAQLNEQWIRYYERGRLSSPDAAVFNDVKETPDRGFVAVGTTSTVSGSVKEPKVWVVKMDSMGRDARLADSLPALPTGDFGIVAYPNPAGDYVDFQYILPTGELNGEVVIYDAIGKEIGRLVVIANAGVVNYNSRNLSNGVYVVSLNTESGKIFTCKLAIQRK